MLSVSAEKDLSDGLIQPLHLTGETRRLAQEELPTECRLVTWNMGGAFSTLDSSPATPSVHSRDPRIMGKPPRLTSENLVPIPACPNVAGERSSDSLARCELVKLFGLVWLSRLSFPIPLAQELPSLLLFCLRWISSKICFSVIGK